MTNADKIPIVPITHEETPMIDLTIHEQPLERAVQRARERNIIIPTFEQQRNPALIPDAVKRNLADVGLWDLNPVNLFLLSLIHI